VRTTSTAPLVASLILISAVGGAAWGQGGSEPEIGWSNKTELSFVFTEGNSDTESLGIRNDLRRRWTGSKLKIVFDAVRADTADDRFLLVDPGTTFPPGAVPAIGGTSVIEPAKEPDVEKYFLESTYDQKLGQRLRWHAGLSWDRNEDAGILNRYHYFGGFGHDWYDSKDFALRTSYGVAYVDREEETTDPEKEDKFAAARVGLHFLDRFGKAATFETDLTSNLNVEDTADYNVNATMSIAVKMTDRLSMKVSLQGLYASEPALEDVDIVARVELLDPDGIAGSGDEFFRTVTNGGAEIELGEGQIRKDELDTVFRASLVIDF
jgi:putative salt-induced outer membrane protein YdiY